MQTSLSRNVCHAGVSPPFLVITTITWVGNESKLRLVCFDKLWIMNGLETICRYIRGWELSIVSTWAFEQTLTSQPRWLLPPSFFSLVLSLLDLAKHLTWDYPQDVSLYQKTWACAMMLAIQKWDFPICLGTPAWQKLCPSLLNGINCWIPAATHMPEPSCVPSSPLSAWIRKYLLLRHEMKLTID